MRPFMPTTWGNRPLAPELDTFAEVFAEWRPIRNIDHDKPRAWAYYPRAGGASLGPYAMFNANPHIRSIWVRVQPDIGERICGDLVVPGALYWQLVVREDGILVTVQYDQILGGRWITLIHADSLPPEIRG